MVMLITDIAASVRDGDDDTVLNAVIQQYLDDWGLTETVAEWRVANYADLRSWAYPDQAAIASGQYSVSVFEDNQDVVRTADLRFPDAPENPATTSASSPYTAIADGVDTFTITNIPEASGITISGPQYYVDEPGYSGSYGDPTIYPSTGFSYNSGTQSTFIFKFALASGGEWWITVNSVGYAPKIFIIYVADVI